ncbi:uncharacterized protein LOC143041405 isoform X3 [Oratosquilla oratoria]
MTRDDDIRCGGADGGKSPTKNGNGEDESARSTDETPPAPCAALCGPRACATLPPNLSQPAEPKRRRLWGLRGLVKMFRRRVRRRAEEGDSPRPAQPTLRARSTSELAVDNPLSMRSTGPYNQGLSVSHDSVFSPDTPTDTHGHGTPPALALATRGVNMAELKAALRRRRCEDSVSGDEDPGLPRSPPTSPTTLDVLNHGLKSSSRATQSTCSDGSLLSMGSSENDEDSLGASSHHSSKASLIDGRHQVVAKRSTLVSDALLVGRDPWTCQPEPDHEPMAGSAPLSHTAARHKIAVRPRRTYGAPRARRNTQVCGVQVVGQLSLPTTPEVNEDSSVKSMTPPVHHPITSSASVGIPKSSSQGKVEPDDPSSTSSSCSVSSSGGADGTGISPTKEKRRSSRERRTSLDRRDSDKGKRDEPFFQRLFGSVRSGRRRSKGDGDSREASVSPMRREEETRSSRDKRRDSSGNRLPVMSRSSARQRHEAHLLPPTPDSASRHRDAEGRGRGRDNNEDRLAVTHHTPRSASVEGRVEGFHVTSAHQQNVHTNFQIASYEDKVRHEGEPEARPVKKANSFREQMMPVRRKDYSRRSWMVQDEHRNEVFDESQVSQKASRLSASFDHLEETSSSYVNQQLSYRSESSLLSSESTRNKHHQTKDLSMGSSCDVVGIPPPSAFSLSPLSFSASKNNQDFGTGPLSLDSSIGSRTSGEEDRIKKSTSVDYLGRTLQPANARVSGDEEETYAKEKEEFPVDFNAQRKSKSIDEGRDFLGDSRSPQAVKRSASHRKSFPRQGSESAEQGESDYPLVALRSLKKEPSVKKIAPPSGESDNLPEFLRIQLNKVESKGNTTTIFDTESEDTDSNLPRVEPLPLSTSPSLGDVTVFESARVHKHARLHHAVSEDGVIDSKRNSDDSFSLSSREATLKREKSSGSLRDEKSPETTVDRVVLRKPLVHERTNVLERSSSVTSQQGSSADATEEPELFKVFARRSFKLKDSDKEKTNAALSDEEHEAEVDKGEISVESAVGVPATLLKGTTPPASECIQQRPMLNSISFNRMSVGNPAVAFKPPHMTKNTSIASSASPKLNLVIISSSPNTSTTGSVFTMGEHASSAPLAGTTTTTTTITSSPSVAFSHPNPSKPVLTSRSSVIWPPVTQQETHEEPKESHPATTSPSSSTSLATSQASRLSGSDQERTPYKSNDSHQPIEVTPLNIGAARRKFQSGTGGRADRPTTPEKTSPTPPPTTPSGPAFVSLKTSTSTTSITTTPSKSPSTTSTEMQNSSPNFTVTVRSHSQSGSRLSGNIFSSTLSKEESTPCTAEQTANVTSSEQQHHVGVEEDWRVLARQRREDRLKQSKNPETQDIIIETRPAVSRNSKVLEMASNFQKLQVA